jgi:hypothetical protein
MRGKRNKTEKKIVPKLRYVFIYSQDGGKYYLGFE